MPILFRFRSSKGGFLALVALLLVHLVRLPLPRLYTRFWRLATSSGNWTIWCRVWWILMATSITSCSNLRKSWYILEAQLLGHTWGSTQNDIVLSYLAWRSSARARLQSWERSHQGDSHFVFLSGIAVDWSRFEDILKNKMCSRRFRDNSWNANVDSFVLGFKLS
ncbi:hypothetical protein SCHPADRAFT_673996 [Schizopora paradoxa]|uniref:Uncharacterized protein n=1 Tax=Schizopora paradoxa TaxID=27342 RepID=A0A0H2R508_9AGAM|nr:hypothetical protein SCHPADRAFT_673996 [Schizopora paradoxa]